MRTSIDRRIAHFAVALSLIASLPVNATTLRVLTYNIHHGVGDDNALDLSRIASVISAANPDIVSLQEVDNGVPRSGSVNQVARLAELTGMQSYFGKARNLDGGSYGNGILVRSGIGIVNTQNFALPNPDNTEPRAVAQLGLSLDSNLATTEFNFFATHLAHDSPSGRQESATYINGLVSASTMPSILAGDMNFNPGSTAFNIIDNQWLDATNIANSGKNRANQIDYVFYRSSSQWDIHTAGQFIINSTTNVASDHHPLLAVLELPNVWPGSALVWNVNSGMATSFNAGFATGNGSAGVGEFPASPWSDPYDTGRQNLIVGYNGNATVSGNVNRTIGSLRIGTNQANPIINGRDGNGTVTASGAMGLLVASSIDSSGDLTVGEGGQHGSMNWNGTGTLEVQGRLRIGQSGTGTFQQAAGVVIAGNMAGSLRFLGIGVDPGSHGTYNLAGGILRPSGGFAGTQFRQTLVGDNGGVGILNVGNDLGAAGSAAIESNDDLIVGRNGAGTLNLKSDGRIELRTTSNQAQLIVGTGSNGTGIVEQTAGSVLTDSDVLIGSGAASNGQYYLSGGTLSTAADGSGLFAVGQNGGVGLLQVRGSAAFTHGSSLYIANGSNTGASGRLEIGGSQASITVAQLVNDTGGANALRETISWLADDNGITPLVVTGAGAAAGSRVQLQSSSELAANVTSGGSTTGDGLALELNLAAITGSRTLMLIENQSADPVQGFFENPLNGNLYTEGAAILGTGFNGTVNISYLGGTGNDVVLNLMAAVPGDHNADGVVDAADYIVWRDTQSSNFQGYLDWRANFGASVGSGPSVNTSVPEPTAILLAAIAFALLPYDMLTRTRRLYTVHHNCSRTRCVLRDLCG